MKTFLAIRKSNGKILPVVDRTLTEYCTLEAYDYWSPTGTIIKTHRQWGKKRDFKVIKFALGHREDE